MFYFRPTNGTFGTTTTSKGRNLHLFPSLLEICLIFTRQSVCIKAIENVWDVKDLNFTVLGFNND